VCARRHLSATGPPACRDVNTCHAMQLAARVPCMADLLSVSTRVELYSTNATILRTCMAPTAGHCRVTEHASCQELAARTVRFAHVCDQAGFSDIRFACACACLLRPTVGVALHKQDFAALSQRRQTTYLLHRSAEFLSAYVVAGRAQLWPSWWACKWGLAVMRSAVNGHDEHHEEHDRAQRTCSRATDASNISDSSQAQCASDRCGSSGNAGRGALRVMPESCSLRASHPRSSLVLPSPSTSSDCCSKIKCPVGNAGAEGSPARSGHRQRSRNGIESARGRADRRADRRAAAQHRRDPGCGKPYGAASRRRNVSPHEERGLL
jgi:hypothetical protein